MAVSQKPDRVQRRKGDVAHAELQRHDEVHQPDHERHRHEEDHDRAVGREDLVVVIAAADSLPRRKASACCDRIMIASEKPRSSMTSASRQYMTPMRLWSTLVIHSRQR